MKTRELKYLKNYLDTGLKCNVNSQMFPDPILTGMNGIFAYFNYHGTYLSFEISKIKPLLLPLSALTEALPDGSIPIVELHKIAHGINEGVVIKYWFVDYTEKKLIGSKGFATLEYYDTSKSVYSFSYDEELCRFITRDETRGVPKATARQLQLFEYLYANHFDIHGLIEANLAIDKRTVK